MYKPYFCLLYASSSPHPLAKISAKLQYLPYMDVIDIYRRTAPSDTNIISLSGTSTTSSFAPAQVYFKGTSRIVKRYQMEAICATQQVCLSHAFLVMRTWQAQTQGYTTTLTFRGHSCITPSWSVRCASHDDQFIKQVAISTGRGCAVFDSFLCSSNWTFDLGNMSALGRRTSFRKPESVTSMS